jgi:hypothetical protein
MGRTTRLLLAGVLGAGLLIGPPGEGAAGASIAVLVGAGDIATCSSWADQRTARLLDDIGGTVFTAGDNAYPRGTLWQFRHCYAPSWGRHFDRTRPAVGNHEYATADADGYFDYFRWRAGERGKGWYAYNRGTWRIYVLNSNCSEVGGCYVGSRQERWLRADLAAHPRQCVLAIWHHPRYSSGFHGNQNQVRGFWVTLYDAGADVVVNGHDHDYERFAPQDYSANADPERGIREFVVGTGGAERRPMETLRGNSEVANASTFGVLKLTLRAGSYAWRFVGVPGSTFTDSGSDACH